MSKMLALTRLAQQRRQLGDIRRGAPLGKLNHSTDLLWPAVAGSVIWIECRAPPQAFKWPWSWFFARRARILASHGQMRCRVCCPALVVIAKNVLKSASHGAGSLSARMLLGEKLRIRKG